MFQAYRVFLALTITFLCVSLAGNISALLGTAWMHVDTIQDGTRMSVEKGLVRSCSERWTTPRNVSCGMNVELFTFDKKRGREIDFRNDNSIAMHLLSKGIPTRGGKCRA